MNRVATFLFGVGAACLLGLAIAAIVFGSPFAGLLPLALAIVHGALAVGSHRDRAWARWIGMGVSGFWSLGAATLLVGASTIRFEATVIAAATLSLHGPLVLWLAQPDTTHPRTATSWLLTGAALIPAVGLGVVYGVGWLLGASPAAAPLIASGLAVAGAVGLARERTWGLFAVGLGGAVLLCAELADASAAHGSHCSDGSLGLSLVATLLLAAALPFGGPAWRYVRSR